MALKMFKSVGLDKASAPKTSFRRHVHRNTAGYEDERTLKNVHASAMTSDDPRTMFCAREYALADLMGHPPRKRFLSTALKMTFDIGRTVEDILRERVLDSLVGHWKCPNCSVLHKFCKVPAKCVECGFKRFTVMDYQEVRFLSQTCGVSCGVDILWDEGSGKLRLVESKSIDKDECKKLVAPMAEHRHRLNWYLRIVAESDSPYKDQIWTDYGIINYTSKGGFGFADPEVKSWGFPDDGFSPFKEFYVYRDDSSTEKFQARARSVLDWRAEFYASGRSPDAMLELPDRVCETSLAARARSCNMCQACFNA